MELNKDAKKIIAIGEHSIGNEEVGSMELYTKSFDINSPIKDIMIWANKKKINGRLIITIDETFG